jgi:hypothetical protein
MQKYIQRTLEKVIKEAGIPGSDSDRSTPIR